MLKNHLSRSLTGFTSHSHMIGSARGNTTLNLSPSLILVASCGIQLKTVTMEVSDKFLDFAPIVDVGLDTVHDTDIIRNTTGLLRHWVDFDHGLHLAPYQKRRFVLVRNHRWIGDEPIPAIRGDGCVTHVRGVLVRLKQHLRHREPP